MRRTHRELRTRERRARADTHALRVAERECERDVAVERGNFGFDRWSFGRGDREPRSDLRDTGEGFPGHLEAFGSSTSSVLSRRCRK